jgi:hypothetical protein
LKYFIEIEQKKHQFKRPFNIQNKKKIQQKNGDNKKRLFLAKEKAFFYEFFAKQKFVRNDSQ